MAANRCLKCGYPLTDGSGCLCGTPTVQRSGPAPYMPPAPRDQEESYVHLTPRKRGAPLPPSLRKQANKRYLEAERTFREYQKKPEDPSLLEEAYLSLNDLHWNYGDALQNREAFYALYGEVRDEKEKLDRRTGKGLRQRNRWR